MSEKTLTVIVPSYNMEKYLPKCLGSLVVAPELMERLEVLVVNDGSKDRTSEIAHGFEARHPGTFHVIDKPNGNYGSCINAALPVASGKYVKVLDADDWFETRHFAEYLAFLNGQADADLVVTDYDLVDETGRVMQSFAYGFKKDDSFGMDVVLRGQSELTMHGCTYRTALLHGLGYRQLEGVSYTDTEWAMIPLLRVRTARYFPRGIYKYLSGRAGQTMDPVRLSRSEWMRGKVVLDIVRQFIRYRNGTAASVREALEERILDGMACFYRRAIFETDGSSVGFDLGRFDSGLKEISEDWYRKVGEVVYSRWIPYRYVRAWRKNPRIPPLLAFVCRLYTKCVRALKMTKVYRCGR